jgi:hypothetical protein
MNEKIYNMQPYEYENFSKVDQERKMVYHLVTTNCSVISRISYCFHCKFLAIKKHNDLTLYLYENIPIRTFLNFIQAKSMDEFYNRYIQGRVSKIDLYSSIYNVCSCKPIDNDTITADTPDEQPIDSIQTVRDQVRNKIYDAVKIHDKYCRRCGAVFNSDDIYCGECGTKRNVIY